MNSRRRARALLFRSTEANEPLFLSPPVSLSLFLSLLFLSLIVRRWLDASQLTNRSTNSSRNFRFGRDLRSSCGSFRELIRSSGNFSMRMQLILVIVFSAISYFLDAFENLWINDSFVTWVQMFLFRECPSSMENRLVKDRATRLIETIQSVLRL